MGRGYIVFACEIDNSRAESVCKLIQQKQLKPKSLLHHTSTRMYQGNQKITKTWTESVKHEYLKRKETQKRKEEKMISLGLINRNQQQTNK